MIRAFCSTSNTIIVIDASQWLSTLLDFSYKFHFFDMAEILVRKSKDYVERLMKSVLERTAGDERDCAMKKYL